MKFKYSLATSIVIVSLVASTNLPSFSGTQSYEHDMSRGRIQMSKKDFEGAVASFTSVLRDNPNVYDAYLNRGISRCEIKDFDGAMSDYDQAIKLNPNVVEVYIKRGDLNAFLNNPQAAIVDFTTAVRLNPKDVVALTKRAAALKQNGDYKKAVEDYTAVLKFDPTSIPIREERADCNVRAFEFDAAIDDYNFLLKKYKSKASHLEFNLAEALMKKGDKVSAGEHFSVVIDTCTRALGKSKKNGADYIRRGLVYAQLEQPDKAIADLQKGVELLPSDANAHYQLGHLLLARGDTKGAIRVLDAALKINPKLNAAIVDRAEARFAEGDYLQARKELDAVLAVEKSANGLLTRAMTRISLGDIGGAIADVQEVKSLNPGSIKHKQQAVSDAITKKESKGEKDLELSQSLSQMAVLSLVDNDLETAESLARRSLDLQEKSLKQSDPRIAYGLILLGKVQLKKRSVLKAEALFRTAFTRLKDHSDSSQKYAIFSLEDCARILIASSNNEEAGAILQDTRMARAVTGLNEQAFSGELARKADRAIESYKQKKKNEQQQEDRKPPRVKEEESESPAVPEPKVVIDKPIRDKWAVIVGISHFKDPHHDLKYAAKDAKDFYDFLIKEKDFAPDHVRLLTDSSATRANILSLLGSKWLPRVAEPDDLVLIYFSGHGSPSSLDVGGVNYLVAYDTDVNDLYTSGIAMQDLARIIKGRVHCNRVMMVLDACHSGAVAPSTKGLAREGNVNVDVIVQGTGQLVLSSSSPEQRSWESKRYEGSVFTKHLIEGFRKNGKLTRLGDAFNHLNQEVQHEVLRDRGVLQNPIMKSKWEGRDLILGATPAAPSRGLDDFDLPDSPTHETARSTRDASAEAKPVKPIVKSKGPTSKVGRRSRRSR